MFGIKSINVGDLLGRRGDGSLRLIDVRSEAEVAQGVIEGAEHLPLHLLPVKAGQLDAGQPTVFYCRSGARSAQACAYLSARGHANVYNLEGGILEWVRSGQPLCSFA